MAGKDFDLYPASRTSRLSMDLFANPTAEYRGTPFWAWNNRLDTPQHLRQIDCFNEMGYGGFHRHSRVGLATRYMGTEFLAAVRACTERARQLGMLAWLYDEDRWPSGSAGGLVTSEPRFTVALDGRQIGPIAFAPFRAELGQLARGPHRLDITAYGNRINAFGAVHNCDRVLTC